MYKFWALIGLTLWLLPRVIVHYWYLPVLALAPFAGMALYYHSWMPYLWWWGVAAAGAVAIGTTIFQLRHFPG